MKLPLTILFCFFLASSTALRHWPRICGSRLAQFLTEQCPQTFMDCSEGDTEEESVESMVVDCCLKPCNMDVARQLCCTYAKEHMGAKPVKFSPGDIYMFKEPLPS